MRIPETNKERMADMRKAMDLVLNVFSSVPNGEELIPVVKQLYKWCDKYLKEESPNGTEQRNCGEDRLVARGGIGFHGR